METSEGIIEVIKTFEGFRAQPYRCPAGVWTIGYGHTGKDTNAEGWHDERGLAHYRITRGQATEILKQDMKSAEKCANQANEALKAARGGTYGLKQNQFDALVSFIYNCGSGAFQRSTLRKLVIDPKATDKQIVAQFLRWNKGGGKILGGLVRRRSIESAWWVYGSRWPEEIGSEKQAIAWAHNFAS